MKRYLSKRRAYAVALITLATLTAILIAFLVVRNLTKPPLKSSIVSILVDGRERTYRVHVPESLPPGKIPLVIMLHGALGTSEQAEKSYGWDAEADKEGFIVAYPDGIKRSWAVSDGCCGPPVKQDVDDVTFIRQVVEKISKDAPIDSSRIYAAGISNGGALAYRLACDTDIFAAVGVVSANLLGECPSPKPISVIHIHGSADETFPLGGGSGKRNNSGQGNRPADTSGQPVQYLITFWRDINQCNDAVSATSGSVTRLAATCSEGRGVELITIQDAGHQWPGQSGSREIASRLLELDPPSEALDATATIWGFFSSHPKP